MQKNIKHSLFFVISALIIGAPAYLLSQTNGTQHVADTKENQPNHAMPQTSNNLYQINQTPAPAAGIHSITGINSQTRQDQDSEYQNPIHRIQAIQNKSELHQSILNDHEQFSRYAEYNQVFDKADQDPVVKRYEIEERTTQSTEDESSLTIWSDKKYYLPGDQATIFASLRNAQNEAIPSNFIGQLIFNEKVNLQTLQFSDQNQDGVYENTLSLSSTAEQTLNAGLYKVLIVNNKNKLSDALTFILSEPEIKLTGSFKDNLTKTGELLIQAEVAVSAKNRFYFQASLYSANQLPIGATQQALELPSGTHWVNLVFDGRMIRDSGESGPFLLKNISLAKVTVPMQRAPLDSAEYFTQDYALNQFNSSNKQQDDKLQAAKSSP